MYKQTLLRFFVLFLCLSLLFSLCLPVFADFGDFGGDNDYGGGDDDYGGGYDWGGGYDNDYSYSSGSRDSGGDGGLDGAIIALIVIIFVVAIILTVSRSGQEENGRSFDVSELPDLEDIENYSEIDPNFSAVKLEEQLSNLYIQMQQCWQAKDIEPLRPYFTDAYFSQLDRQLDAYRKNGVTNFIDRPAVLSVKLEGFCQEDEEDHIYATVRTRIVDYRVDDHTGNTISGSRTAEKFMTYRYHLTRPTGMVSDSEDGVRSLSCPHCGAPVSVNESARCPYCGSLVTAENHDFVIARIEGIAQETKEL